MLFLSFLDFTAAVNSFVNLEYFYCIPDPTIEIVEDQRDQCGGESYKIFIKIISKACL